MKKISLAFGIVLFMSACAQQSIPEYSTYKNQKIQLDAVATPGLFDAEFTININGQEVIKSRSKAFGGSSQSFEGVWEGKTVVARATRVQKFASTYIMIDVFIDGTLVETLVV